MKNYKTIVIVSLLLLVIAVTATAIEVAINPEIHMDIPGVIANDFHLECRIDSGLKNSNWSQRPVLLWHVDAGFPEFKITIEEDHSDPEQQNKFIVRVDWSGHEYEYCSRLHLGIGLDVTCHNIMVDVVCWWTKDGERIREGNNGGTVLVPGFEVLDFDEVSPQKIQIRNDSHISGNGIPGRIVQMDLVKLTQDEIDEAFGSVERLFYELQSEGRESELDWIPVAYENGTSINNEPVDFSAGNYIDVYMNNIEPLPTPGPIDIPIFRSREPIILEPGNVLVSRVAVEYRNNNGEYDKHLTWKVHRGHYRDFGDAPLPFQTLLVNNGARHIIRGPWFGDNRDRPDGERDGQPHISALGDDINVRDDENGVKPQILVRGYTSIFPVEVSGGGVVSAWIDFDNDDFWNDPGERIIGGFYPPGSHLVNINVPAGTSNPLDTETYCRFRISSNNILPPEGASKSGEVEDYITRITYCGDVDYTGTVDIVDALRIAQYYVGILPSLDPELADVNCDGSIDIVDALILAQMYVGLPVVLNCCPDRYQPR